MSWEERRRTPSWRGLLFEFESDSAPYGRETVEHQFPLRDEVFVEELSIAPIRHSIRGFLIGDDHDLERERWIAEAQKGGSGTLIHPVLGRLEVTLVKPGLTFEDSKDAQGRSAFTLECVESSPRIYPAARVQTNQQLTTQNEAMRVASDDAFAGAFNVVDVPGWVFDRVNDYLVSFSTTTVDALANDWNDITEEQWLDIFEGFEAIPEGTSDLIFTDPAAWAGLIQDSLDTLPYFDFAKLFVELLGDDPEDSSIGSGSWDQEIANHRAIIRRERRAALSVLVDVLIAGQVEIETDQQAEGLRDLLIELFDAELNREDASTSPELFEALYATKLAALIWLEGETASLETIREFTPTKVTPLLVIAQRLYADPDRVDEIIALNSEVLEHPLFAPGGVTLLVRAS